jgi:hypothetical protein
MKNRYKSGGAFAQATKFIEEQSKKGFKDDRFWMPTLDNAGNGTAVIRLLPAPDGEDASWVNYYEHAFAINGKWYIEKSLTSLGRNVADPVAEANTALWNSGFESDKNIARERKRKLRFVSNILVVQDKANPDMEGKVKLFRYGKSVFDKIKGVMQPEFDDDQPIDPFDPFNGANLRLVIKRKSGYPNYDDSKFLDTSPIAKTDEEIEAIWHQCSSLQALVAPDQFKSYDELKRLFDAVVGGLVAKTAEERVSDLESNMDRELDVEDDAPIELPKDRKGKATKVKPASDFDIDPELEISFDD